VQCSGKAGEKVYASSHDIVVPQSKDCSKVAGGGNDTDLWCGYAVVTDEQCIPERLKSTANNTRNMSP
jgi:hypothetical protein